MSSPSLTIRTLYARHKDECPDSAISEKAIREAVRTGELPSVHVGNRALVCYETFEMWRRGEFDHEH